MQNRPGRRRRPKQTIWGVPATIGTTRTREEWAEIAESVELLLTWPDPEHLDGEGEAQRLAMRTATQVAEVDVILDPGGGAPGDDHTEHRVIIPEIGWIDVDDRAELAEGGRNPLQVLVLLREVDRRDDRQSLLLNVEAVRRLLGALQGQAGAVMEDGAQVDHGVPVATVVEPQHHAPPRGRVQAAVDSRGHREQSGTDEWGGVVGRPIDVD